MCLSSSDPSRDGREWEFPSSLAHTDGKAMGKSTPLMLTPLRHPGTPGGDSLSPAHVPRAEIPELGPAGISPGEPRARGHLRCPSPLLSRPGTAGINPTNPSRGTQPGPRHKALRWMFPARDGSPQAGHSWSTAGLNRHSWSAPRECAPRECGACPPPPNPDYLFLSLHSSLLSFPFLSLPPLRGRLFPRSRSLGHGGAPRAGGGRECRAGPRR